MIRLIATDMDGTLLDSEGRLDSEIYEIIKELKDMGIMFAAASGRQLMSLKRKFEPVDDDIIYIAENGGYAVKNDEELYVNAMDRDVVCEILEDVYKRQKESFITEAVIKRTKFKNTDLRYTDFFKTPLKGVDLSKCDIEGMSVSDSLKELKGLKISPLQSVEIAKMTGVEFV